jgi:hypothetical protein
MSINNISDIDPKSGPEGLNPFPTSIVLSPDDFDRIFGAPPSGPTPYLLEAADLYRRLIRRSPT